MIPTLQWFPEENKEQYREGVAKLWAKIENNPENSPEYQIAYKKLVEVSINIKTKRKRAQDAAMAAGQQNGARPMSSGQPSQLDGRPPTQSAGQPSTQEYSNKVIEEVRRLKILPPVAVAAQGSDSIRAWVTDAQNKYATHLQRLESYANQLRELHYTINQRQTQGRTLTPLETEQIRARKERIELGQRDTREFLNKFQKQQEGLRAQQAQSQPVTGQEAGLSTSQAPNASTHAQEHKSGMNAQVQAKAEPAGQPHTVSSAVDAARNLANQAPRSAMAPQNNNGKPSQLPPNQPPTSRPQSNHNQIATSHPPLNVNTNTRAPDHQHNSPHVAPIQQTSLPQEPVPLSHQAAMEQARSSYSQSNVHQPTPQSATHGHPPDSRSQQNQAKMPIPKELNVAPLQPVSTGPSRPTLTNGPGPMGPMGQPALQRHPGYVLEGEGERVLSKKKLEELVRQVTGGTGGEGEEGEALTAEVEEVSSIPQHKEFSQVLRLIWN